MKCSVRKLAVAAAVAAAVLLSLTAFAQRGGGGGGGGGGARGGGGGGGRPSQGAFKSTLYGDDKKPAGQNQNQNQNKDQQQSPKQKKSSSKNDQTPPPPPKPDYSKLPFPEASINSFRDFYMAGIQEKLYIQTDKPYYSAGEKIWFKGYLVNAITTAPLDWSRFIYVEMVDFKNDMLTRVKIKYDSTGGFANSIALPNNIPPGDYSLRGYTTWMRNWPEAFFFSKTIRVVNPLDDSFSVTPSYSTADSHGNITVTLKFANNQRKPIVNTYFDYITVIDGKSKNSGSKTNADGVATITIPRPQDDRSDNIITVTIPEGNVTGKKIVALPAFGDDYDVQFFPEGGHLLSGVLQNIAFKAIGTNGLGLDVDLKVFKQTGEQLLEASSTHKGMGRFSMIAEPGASYYATISSPASPVTRKIDLPAVESTGCTIQANRMKSKIIYRINVTPGIDPSRLGVVIHSKGRFIAAEELARAETVKAMDETQLPEGILSIDVVDKVTKEPLAERIVFVKGNGQGKCDITTDKSVYARRSNVRMSLSFSGPDGKPLTGSFSMAVTDASAVVADTLSDNILSYLLLSSDIKGYVEEPAYYFSDDPDAAANLDLLLMTQGWKRFDIKSVLTGNIPQQYDFLHEDSQTISGEISGFFGQNAKTPTIMIFRPATGYMDQWPLGNTNKFRFTDLDIPDSTSFILQAVNRSGGTGSVTLKIQPETFPAWESFIPKPSVGALRSHIPDAFLSQAKESYYDEGGMQVVNLGAVEIQAKKPEEQRTLLYNAQPSYSLSEERISHFPGADILSLIRMLPGVQVNTDGGITVRGSAGPPVIYVDDMEIDPEDLISIMPMDVATIDLVDGAEASMFGMEGGNGVILIGLKDGKSLASSIPTSPSLANVAPLGYKKPDAFYQPKYETEAQRNSPKPDLRTTIHWEPNIVPDSTTGAATVSFYTADPVSKYNVILEGVGKDGEIVMKRYTIDRK